MNSSMPPAPIASEIAMQVAVDAVWCLPGQFLGR
jgi:hypothetical protein